MGRQIRRVPLDFGHPLNEVWSGFLSPEKFREVPCGPCDGQGYSPFAQELHDQWYGNSWFEPWETGSEPLTAATPQVREFAERNVDRAPDYYGTGEAAIVREATRLAKLFNGMWMHHLSQDDVDALVAADQVWDLTHVWSREGGWQRRDPAPVLTAAQVNAWSLTPGAWPELGPVLTARCAKAGQPVECQECEGHGSAEAYPGQRAEADAWEPTDPPEGEGWQLWETVSEGSPISPVFASAEALAGWLADPDRDKPKAGPEWFESVMASLGEQKSQDRAPRDWMPYEAALAFVRAGWAPSAVGTPEAGVVPGAEFVGWRQVGASGG
jgi:hypothetical protein